MENRINSINDVLKAYEDLLLGYTDNYKEYIYKDAVFIQMLKGHLCTEPLRAYISQMQETDIHDFSTTSVNAETETMAYALVSYERDKRFVTNVLGLVKDQERWMIVLSMVSESEDPLNNWFSSIEEQTKELSNIIKAIDTYIEGIYTLDSSLALSVFEEHARMLSTDKDGNLADFPCTVFGERWKGLCPASESGISKYGNVENICMLSNNLAVVQVMDAKRWDFFHDYLSFAKINEKWMVIHKITRMPTSKR